jgi:type VI secretion system protein ImpH
MAGTNGQAANHLIDALAREPYAFDFYRAVRLLESCHPERPRIGYSYSPSEDPIRFAQNPSLGFAPSSLEKLDLSNPDGVPRLFVHLFGLFGPNGPLPPHVTEYAHDRDLHYGDRTITAFCNVFHHRLLSFFYRAWAANQKSADLDRADEQRYATYIGSFFGIGMDSLQERDAVSDWAKLYFAGRLANQTRNAEGLEAILQQYFEIRTRIETFVGRWMDLPPDSVCQLGHSRETGQLGVNTIVGKRFWECQLNFRIHMGPMKLKDYQRMLPGGDAFLRLKYWVLNYCGEHFFWDIQLVLEAAEVPQTCLGQAGRLGWTTWLKTKPFPRDAEDLVLIPPTN